MDIFVMASTYEGGPTTVLEAMAMATPVVASCVGMVPEVIADGATGLIVPPGDSTMLAKAVTGLVGDDALRAQLGERARAHALTHFSIDLMVDRYLDVFAEALSTSGDLRRLVRAIG
jgi:glycosyltransferase involved in cell wall biosynthesis